jgi:type I restriction enzyme S subunit
MKRAFLLDVAELRAQSVRPWRGERLYLATGDADDRGRLAPTPVRFATKPSRANLVAYPGDVVFARMAATRKVFIVDQTSAEFVYSTGFAIAAPKLDVLDAGYLMHWLQTRAFQSAKDSHSSGATQRAITNEGLAKLVIPLPPLDQQRHAAAALTGADAIRSERAAVLQQLNLLRHSIFGSMFGDPLVNERGMPVATVGAVARVVTGNSPSRADPANFGNSIEWIKSNNLGGDVATKADEGLSEKGQVKARIAPAGSVLVTCIAGSPTSIGKASIVDRDVAFNQQINAVLPSAQLRMPFFLAQLKVAPELVRRQSTGGMKGLVSKSAFEAITTLVPPLELQDAFGARVESIQTEMDVVARALAADEELFASLQTRAFSGML